MSYKDHISFIFETAPQPHASKFMENPNPCKNQTIKFFDFSRFGCIVFLEIWAVFDNIILSSI